MGKKALFTLGLTGLLVSTLSFQGVQAEGFDQEVLNKMAEKRAAHVSTQTEERLVQSSTVTRAATTYFMESEPNNSYAFADAWSMANPVKGQFSSIFDEDYYKITIPRDGKLILKGTSTSNIDLFFDAIEKDWTYSSKLIWLEDEWVYNPTARTEVQAYQAKAGTYYVFAFDMDYEKNSETESYTLTASFVDNIKPVKPIINKVDNNDLVVTGKAEANSTVTVKKGTTVLKTVKASTTGTFSAAIPVQKAGTQLSVTAKDSTGNVSTAATATVVDVIAPSKPTINKVDDNDLKVTGKAEASSTISVKVGTTSIGTATTNSVGVYSVAIKAQKKGTTLSVTAKDKAGNTSAKSTYIVVAH